VTVAALGSAGAGSSPIASRWHDVWSCACPV